MEIDDDVSCILGGEFWTRLTAGSQRLSCRRTGVGVGVGVGGKTRVGSGRELNSIERQEESSRRWCNGLSCPLTKIVFSLRVGGLFGDPRPFGTVDA